MYKPYIIIVILLLLVGCKEIIEVPNITNETVLLVAPTDSTEVSTGSVNFTWESVIDAEQYHLQVATPDFANASQVVVDSVVVNTTFTATLTPNNYEWRVQAQNSAYETEYFSNVFEVLE